MLSRVGNQKRIMRIRWTEQYPRFTEGASILEIQALISGIRYIQAEDRYSHKGPVAQRLEQGTHNPLVGGSNPSGPTKYSVKK